MEKWKLKILNYIGANFVTVAVIVEIVLVITICVVPFVFYQRKGKILITKEMEVDEILVQRKKIIIEKQLTADKKQRLVITIFYLCNYLLYS